MKGFQSKDSTHVGEISYLLPVTSKVFDTPPSEIKRNSLSSILWKPLDDLYTTNEFTLSQNFEKLISPALISMFTKDRIMSEMKSSSKMPIDIISRNENNKFTTYIDYINDVEERTLRDHYIRFFGESIHVHALRNILVDSHIYDAWYGFSRSCLKSAFGENEINNENMMQFFFSLLDSKINKYTMKDISEDENNRKIIEKRLLKDEEEDIDLKSFKKKCNEFKSELGDVTRLRYDGKIGYDEMVKKHERIWEKNEADFIEMKREGAYRAKKTWDRMRKFVEYSENDAYLNFMKSANSFVVRDKMRKYFSEAKISDISTYYNKLSRMLSSKKSITIDLWHKIPNRNGAITVSGKNMLEMYENKIHNVIYPSQFSYNDMPTEMNKSYYSYWRYFT